MKAVKMNKKLWIDVTVEDIGEVVPACAHPLICGCGCGGCCCPYLCAALIC